VRFLRARRLVLFDDEDMGLAAIVDVLVDQRLFDLLVT
jgi:hypothetical protein